MRRHVDFAHFLHEQQARGAGAEAPPLLAKCPRSYLDASFAPGDALVFGRESVGLPEALLAEHRDRVVAIPTLGAVRSLNLANAVGIALYEALRQSGALGETYVD